MKVPFIVGKRLYLRPLLEEDIGEAYLSWLNDPDVLAFRNRRLLPSTLEELKSFQSRTDSSSTVHLAMVIKSQDKHIGNIQLGPIHWLHRKAEISILIGDKSSWGQGYAKEAIYLMTRHAFRQGNLHRVYAASANPAFVKAVESLGWTREGSQREAFWDGQEYRSIILHGLLAADFRIREEYEHQVEK